MRQQKSAIWFGKSENSDTDNVLLKNVTKLYKTLIKAVDEINSSFAIQVRWFNKF